MGFVNKASFKNARAPFLEVGRGRQHFLVRFINFYWGLL